MKNGSLNEKYVHDVMLVCAPLKSVSSVVSVLYM